MPKVVIANTLADGFVAFLSANGEWSRDIAASTVAHTEAEAEQLLEQATAAARANVVIDPYLIDVELSGDAAMPRPSEYREYIRAFGPSVDIPS